MGLKRLYLLLFLFFGVIAYLAANYFFVTNPENNDSSFENLDENNNISREYVESVLVEANADLNTRGIIILENDSFGKDILRFEMGDEDNLKITFVNKDETTREFSVLTQPENSEYIEEFELEKNQAKEILLTSIGTYRFEAKGADSIITVSVY